MSSTTSYLPGLLSSMKSTLTSMFWGYILIIVFFKQPSEQTSTSIPPHRPCLPPITAQFVSLLVNQKSLLGVAQRILMNLLRPEATPLCKGNFVLLDLSWSLRQRRGDNKLSICNNKIEMWRIFQNVIPIGKKLPSENKRAELSAWKSLIKYEF